VDEFREKVLQALNANERGWVVDGNYTARVGLMVDEIATDIIWLDPPLVLYFPRLCVRTFLRIMTIGPPCSPGCNETIQSIFFSKDSILLWCLTHHSVVRKRGESMMRECQGKIKRLGGWGSELALWWSRVEAMALREGLHSP